MATPEDQLEARQGVTGAQVALILVGLVVLLVALWLVFLRSPGEVTVATPPAPVPTVEPEPEETAEPDRRRRRGPLQTFEVFAPKDPFRPLIAAAGGTAGAPAGATDGNGTGTTGNGNGTAPSGGSDISGDGGSRDVRGHRVRLIDTFRAGGEARARVQVDGTVYTVGEGDRFAENFQVMSLSGSCASLLFGDDQFSLCEGEEILK